MLLPSLVASLLVTSCAKRDASFIIVDAGTQKPLAGVAAVHETFPVNLLFSHKPQTKALPETEDDGLIHLQRLDLNMGHSLRLSKQGYRDAVVGVGTGNGEARPKIYIASPIFTPEPLLLDLDMAEQPVQVKLHPTTPAKRK